jgi:hypothetical protein
MKGSTAARVALAAVLALVPAGLFGQAADVAGEWDVTINSPQGSNQSLLTLKKDGDAWSGSLKGARGERALQDISWKGNELRFAMKINFQGQDAVFTYVGTLEKGALKGTADFAGMATGDWSAVRHVAGSAAPPAAGAPAPPAAAGAIDISGNWVFAVETGAGSGQPTFTFKQDGEKLTGTYTGAFGSGIKLTGTVKGGEVAFSFSGEAQGQSAEVVYKGKIVNKDSMQGTVALAGLGEGTWTGKRQ